MTFDRARTIVEARLYEYGTVMLQYPDSPPSSLSKRLGIALESSDTTSAQERWAVRYGDLIRNAEVIERVLKMLPDDERRLVEMRYFEFARWDYVCRRLAVSRPTAYRIRDRAIMAFAVEFGLLPVAVAK